VVEQGTSFASLRACCVGTAAAAAGGAVMSQRFGELLPGCSWVGCWADAAGLMGVLVLAAVELWVM